MINVNVLESYRMPEEREKNLWNIAIFIFDTSALLDLYLFTSKSRKSIYSEIFEKLKDRLWVTYQIYSEYSDNRDSTIEQPIQKYDGIKPDFTEVHKTLNNLKESTKKDDKHPYIEKLDLDIEEFKTELKEFEDKIVQKIENAKKSIIELNKTDDILENINKHFSMGIEIPYSRVLEILKEGKHRFECQIPPGFGDHKKPGTQKYADLIIWNEILDFSHKKGANTPIVLITNDSTKSDWCIIDNKNNKRIIAPHKDLIKEIKDKTGADFWMYNLEQFLFNAEKLLKSKIDIDVFKNQLFTQSAYYDFISDEKDAFRCANCGCIHQFESGYVFENAKKGLRSIDFSFKCGCGNKIQYTVFDNGRSKSYKCLGGINLGLELIGCLEECDDGSNLVELSTHIEIKNKLKKNQIDKKYEATLSGCCNWCNTFHFFCPKCGSVNSVSVELENEQIECTGGCGLVYVYQTDPREKFGSELQIIKSNTQLSRKRVRDEKKEILPFIGT